MAGPLSKLGDKQRQLLTYGLPVVAVFALITVIGKKKAATAVAGTPAVPVASTDVLGTGQLAEYESNLTGVINGLSQQVDNLANAPAVAPVVSTPTPAPPAPPPSEQLPTIPSQDFSIQGAPGEQFMVLGAITGPGAQYTGVNISGGAPVYANINGTWQQDYDVHALPQGTQLATPTIFQQYVTPGVVVENLS